MRSLIVFITLCILALSGCSSAVLESGNPVCLTPERDPASKTKKTLRLIEPVCVIDIKNKKLVSTITISGVPEFVAYDPTSDRIYQNIKTNDTLVVINPNTNKVEATWSTLPVTSPHGLAVDSKTGRVFFAGRNGKLAAIDMKTGKVTAQAEIAPGTDQITFDASSKTIYCASKGFISAVKETDSGFEGLGNVPTHERTHTLAVDSARHEVWASYADKEHSYLQKFKTPPKP